MHPSLNRRTSLGFCSVFALCATVLAADVVLAQTQLNPPSGTPRASKTCTDGQWRLSWNGSGPPGTSYRVWKSGAVGSPRVVDSVNGLTTLVSVRQGQTGTFAIQACPGTTTSSPPCSNLSNSIDLSWFIASASCGAGGGCRAQGKSSAVVLGGSAFVSVENCPYELTRIASDADGGRFLVDDWAVLDLDTASFGKGIVDRLAIGNASTAHFAQAKGACMDTGSFGGDVDTLRASLSGKVSPSLDAGSRSSMIVIDHPQHPLNKRYMPDPEISLKTTLVPHLGRSIHGVARFEVDMDASIVKTELVHADGTVAKEMLDRLAENLAIDYVDERRHHLTTYVLFTIETGELRMRDSLVALWKCCPNCPDPPFVCQ